MSNKRKKGPYGCKCQTLAHKLVGDGCDECQPMGDAPERVWIDHDDWDWYDTKPERPATEYVRADTAEARIRELEEAVGAWWSSHRPIGIDAEKHATPEYRNVNCPSNTGRRLADLAADIVLARRALNRETNDE